MSGLDSIDILSITILGSTGSIGKSTLDVIALHPQRFKVYALTANSSVNELFEQCKRFHPSVAVLQNEDAASQLRVLLQQVNLDIRVESGELALIDAASHDDVDAVMAAIVGAAGLKPTLAAAQSGKKVLLANKESLVMAGKLFMDEIKASGSVLLPIDSEHNAIFQCLPAHFSQPVPSNGVKRIILTGSGGPFRKLPLDQFASITPDQACAHPNWSMGRKISVDSATMMNKGLELIEACWLFETTPEYIDIVIHPQSIIHSMVQYADGSTLAQMGNPDMRTPIAYGLAWPARIDSGVTNLDIIAAGNLSFEQPDEKRFPCLRLAREAFAVGKTAAAVLNASNEVAVAEFLNNTIGFLDIAKVNEAVLEKTSLTEPDSLEVVIKADNDARQLAEEIIGSFKR